MRSKTEVLEIRPEYRYPLGRSWYQNERDHHADLARWWLTRALLPNGGRWDGAEAAHHATRAAHYDRLERSYRRHLTARGLRLGVPS